MNEENNNLNNNLNNGTNNSGNTVKVVLITLLVVLVIGLIGFIVYDKVIKKDDVNNQPNTSENNNQSENKESSSVPSLTLTDKEIYNVNNSFSSDDEESVMLPYIISDSEKALLQDLAFSSNNINNKVDWWSSINKLEDFNIEKMNRNDKMAVVAYLSNYSFNESDNTTFISEDSMKELYEKVFGTQDPYQNVNSIFKNGTCVIPSDYSSKDKGYYGNAGCGGDMAGYMNFYTVISKVEKTNDEISVYLQAAHSFQYMDEDNVALFPYNYEGNKVTDDDKLDTTNAIWSGSENKVDSTVVDLAKQNKLQTYKFTFKKQSDGKYYVYSGEWQ